MIDYLNGVMRHCAELISGHIHDGEPDEELLAVMRSLNYLNAADNDFHYDNELYDAYYFMRYGYAYAFEYATIYGIILKDYEPDAQNKFGVMTLGCGSCIDAWSLAYANSKRPAGGQRILRYMGNDLNVWAIRMKPEEGNAMRNAYPYDSSMLFPENENDGYCEDICEFLRNREDQRNYKFSYNAIMFSKILNELPEDVLDDLLDIIEENADRFKSDRIHYICISHSINAYKNNDRMKTIAQEIADRINHDNRFEIVDDLPSDWDLGQAAILKNIGGDNLACYDFVKSEEDNNDVRIINLNEDFRPIPEVASIYDFINEYRENHSNIHACVIKTSTSLFQIIKLVPRQE